MGFRDLKLFNISLLAKQLWRIHCVPSSLLARSLKARYFPTTSIWEAKNGTNPSYVWRSILSSRSTLALGVRWRIGDGTSIKLWEDAWLGGSGSGKLITPVRGLDRHATVDAIIDRNNHSWRLDIINEIFFPIDVDRIKAVPISSTGAGDERSWAAADDGVFRVRDMYALALNAQHETSSSTGCDPMWTKLWKLNVPPKARIFLWRASWDILPHGINLRNKGIEGVGHCQRCGAAENNNHVLKECSWTRQVWGNILPLNGIAQFITFREWLAAMMEQKTKEEVELFSVCAWQVWSARNDLLFEKIYVSPELCVRRAADMLVEYKRASSSVKAGSSRRQNARWIPPDPEFIKINVDASINSNADRVGVGLVARTATGEVIHAASKSSWPVISAERAEIDAFQLAVDTAVEKKWNKVIVEGDAQVVVNALNGKISRGTHAQVMVDNITYASRSVPHISFSFCFREANAVAHRLAKWASSHICSSVWLDSGPSWISDIVFADLTT